MADISVSLSSVQSYRKCPQQYAYSYVEGLKPKVSSAPMDLGTVLHGYLERYYENIKSGIGYAEAHQLAQAGMQHQYAPYLNGMANTAKAMGAWDVAEDFAAMLPKAVRIAERYHLTRGIADADRYEILLIERKLQARVAPSIVSNGKADMLTRDRLSGQVLMWEHKTTTAIPSHGYRLRDLQTVLYIAKLRLIKYQATGVLWNYLRTREPKEPELNKAGKAMNRTKIDTTWEVYRQAVITARLDPHDYADMQEKFVNAEEENFFPRFEYTANSGGERVLLEDYRASALRIAADRAAWERGERPIRHESRDCDYCDFAKLCTAVLSGKDDTMVRQMWFSTPAERKAEYGITS